MTTLSSLQEKIDQFVKERDWKQYHSPKNLAIGLGVEASENQEIFQWMTEEESYQISEDQKQDLTHEIGDVLIFLMMLSSKYDIDPLKAAKKKLQKNEEKYPVAKSKGSAKKYFELADN